MHQLIIVWTAKYLFALIVVVAIVAATGQPPPVKVALIKRSVGAVVLAIIFTKVGGALYFDPRPFVQGHFQPLIAHAPDNGFPSDHTVVSMTAALLCLSFDRRTGAGLSILAVIVGLSRIACGLHTYLDIAGAIVFAAAAVALVTRLVPQVGGVLESG